MVIENELMKQLIDKFNDLFITKRKKYLILKTNGEYIQLNNNNTNSFVSLNDIHIKRHLQGKETIGVFAGEYNTKFICFDIDFHDPSLAKWHTYKVVDTLIHIGIPSKYIHVSISGNKGYHVDIYFSKMITPDLCKLFFDLVIEQGELYSEYGKVEFRPSNQGLKLPLGINFKNKDNKTNKCWYVDYNNGLKPIKSYKYILKIEKLNPDVIQTIIESHKDITIEYNAKLIHEGLNVEKNKEELDEKHKPLPIYKRNLDEVATIEAAEQLEKEGLKYKGSRHNSLFLLCRYFKYLDCDMKDNIQMLTEWLKRQNKEFYTTSWEMCIKDIKEIAKYIYENNIGLINPNKEISITYSEMLNVLKAKTMNDKLIAYSMLIHSKRYASKNGVFYMSYKQISETTGMSDRTAIRTVKKLEELNVIEVIERNISSGNSKSKFKKPNKYRIVEMDSELGIILTYSNDFINNEPDMNRIFETSIIGMFNFDNLNTLKQLVPKNKYYMYKDVISNSLTSYDYP